MRDDAGVCKVGRWMVFETEQGGYEHDRRGTSSQAAKLEQCGVKRGGDGAKARRDI
jgi:hypothetical protein